MGEWQAAMTHVFVFLGSGGGCVLLDVVVCVGRVICGRGGIGADGAACPAHGARGGDPGSDSPRCGGFDDGEGSSRHHAR